MSVPATYYRFHRTPWLLSLPAGLLFLAFYLLPLTALLGSSFLKHDPATYEIINEFTTENYERFLFDSYYLQILLRTIKLASIVTVLAIFLGYPVAYYMTRVTARSRAYIMLALLSPLLISVVIRSLGWLIILGPGGMLPSLFQWLNIEMRSAHFIYTEFSVVLGLLHIDMTFMTLAIYASLRGIDGDLNRAASNLGASAFGRFVYVTFPLSLPGIIAGSVIVFALSASSFVTPAILGGSTVKVVPFLIWEEQLVLLNWPFGAAISFILLFITTGILLFYQLAIERGRYSGVFR